MKSFITLLIVCLGLVSCQTSNVTPAVSVQAKNDAMLQKFNANSMLRNYKKVPYMPLPLLNKDGGTLAYRRLPINYKPSEMAKLIKKQAIEFHVYAELYESLQYNKEKFITALYSELLREKSDPNYTPQYTFSAWRSTAGIELAVLVEKVK